MNSKSLLLAAFFLLAMTTTCGSAAPAAHTQASSVVMVAATETVAADNSTATLAATDTPLPASVPTTTISAELKSESTATLAPAAAANSSAGFPTGSFTPNHPVHTKILVFNQDGRYQFLGIVEQGKTAAIPVGTYTVSGDHVTFLDALGAASACPKQPGEYTWSFDGSALVFKMVNDECDERRIDLTNSTWTKEP